MSNKPRYVFDTNVVISAVLFEQGGTGQAFYKALDHGEILLSEEVAQEINEVLNREKFSRYVTLEERELFLKWFIREVRLVEITEEIQECRDPSDDRFLELAVSGIASHLITGDEDLLALNPFRGIRILTPIGFSRFPGPGQKLSEGNPSNAWRGEAAKLQIPNKLQVLKPHYDPADSTNA